MPDKEYNVVTDQSKNVAETGGDAQVREANVPSPRRRALVRGAAAAVPTILTLHSGAALARSSNLLGTIDNLANANDPANCLDTSGLNEVQPNVYDLGTTPSSTVNVLPGDKTYYTNSTKTTVANREAMCENGGTYYTSTGQQIQLPQGGGLVSATSLSSFAGRVIVREL